MTKKQKILNFVFILIGAAAVLFFGMRAMHAFKRMRSEGPFGKPPPAKQSDINLIREWMTVPYVARMYDVPPDALFKSLDIPGYDNNKKSLKELNDELYPGQPGVILAHIQAAIQALQRQEPPPEFPATPIPVTPAVAP